MLTSIITFLLMFWMHFAIFNIKEKTQSVQQKIKVVKIQVRPLSTYETYLQFISMTPKIHKFEINGSIIKVDIHHLMEHLINTESDFKITKQEHAFGLCQIEPNTFKAMYIDKRFKERKQEIEKHFNVDLKKYRDDDFTNMVASLAVLEYKIMASPEWYKKFKNKIKNSNQTEWYLYKLYYNSLDGAATYKRWSREYIGGTKE